MSKSLQTACIDIVGDSWQAGELASQISNLIQKPGSPLHAWAPLVVGYGGETDNPRAIAAGYKEMGGV